MKSYSMLSVIWLVACGAASDPSSSDDASLKLPLNAAEDEEGDTTDEDDTTDEGDTNDEAPIPGDPVATEWAPDGDGTGTATADPGLVVAPAGGDAWAAPANGTVVWCHADVVAGCPVIEPAPAGGRLLVVQAGEAAPASAESTAAGVASFSAIVPVPDGTAALPELPVIVGGSLPPLPGTCVAVSIGAIPTGGGASGTPASADPDWGAAPAPGLPIAEADPVAPTPEPGSAEPDDSELDPVAGQPIATPVAADDEAPTAAPSSGGFVPLPSLPLPGNCFGVGTLPAGDAAPLPDVAPGTSAPDDAPVPGLPQVDPAALPGTGACFGVMFTSADGSRAATPMAVPLLCPTPPGTGHGSAPYPSDPGAAPAAGHAEPGSDVPPQAGTAQGAGTR